MSEERMERKCVTRSVPPKAPVDCKKSSDGGHKPWPRGCKKRDVPGGSGKNEAPRRNLPAPRGGAGSGRGRARGQHAVGREEGSGLAEEEEAELGSVFVPGPKKQSLNHLLNFSYAGRERAPAAGAVRRPPVRPRGVAPHPHDRDLFLQASCQFLVKAGADYSAHLLDPDLPVSWDLIEQIVVRAVDGGECPVCLGRPAAARVTRCGHVYCWACALHYVAVHERSPPPCPVCAAPLHIAQLKSARLQRWHVAGEEVCMRLVRRARGSVAVEPAPERSTRACSAVAAPPLPAWDPAAPLPFAKMFTVTTEQVRDIIVQERKELQDQILAEIDTSELEYLEQALRLLQEEEARLARDASAVSAASTVASTAAGETDAAVPAASTAADADGCGRGRLDWFDVAEGEWPAVLELDDAVLEADDGERKEAVGAAADARPPEEGAGDAEHFPLLGGAEEEPGDAPPLLTELDRDNQARYFYFYQAEDGQHVFLHGVDVRLLVASWGALAAAPALLRGRLLRRETFSLTHQSRKHMPCAAHLPLYCPYDVVELELAPPYVTAHALATLAEELERRARTRARAEREERRREQRAAAAAARPAAPHLASHAHFPPAASSYSPPPLPPPHLHSPAAAASPSGLSFAKMASTSGAWRVRTPRAATPPPPAGADDDDDAPPAPRAALCLSDAIEAALLAPATSASAAASDAAPRRKKNKHKLLFATGVQRAA